MLLFDVFGTVVDWRGSIVREARRVGRSKGVRADWSAFADAWRSGYRPAMDRVRCGELRWLSIDALHRMILDELLRRFELPLTEREKGDLNAAWHRLAAWPDTVAGLKRLKRRYVIGTLSNGNVALLLNLARRRGLPWDRILSAELFHRYKPDPAVYLGAVELVGLARPHGAAGSRLRLSVGRWSAVRDRHRTWQTIAALRSTPTISSIWRGSWVRNAPAPTQACFNSLQYSCRRVSTCDMRSSTGTSL